MINSSIIKLVKSLSDKKNRSENNLFVAEGNKIVNELINCNYSINFIISNEKWFLENESKLKQKIFVVNENELKRVSFLKTPQDVLAVCNIKINDICYNNINDNIILALDGIQDPGNFGTIIRIADWFGIKNIITNIASADVYNPKVIQATMGAFARVNVCYKNLTDELLKLKNSLGFTVYGATLSGENIYTTKLEQKCVIVMGSEGNGISKEVLSLLNKEISIPTFSENQFKTESLNVANATAIVCSEFLRRKFK